MVVAKRLQKNGFSKSLGWSVGWSDASERLGVKFGIVDPELAPTPAVGDSVASLEEMGLETVGQQRLPCSMTTSRCYGLQSGYGLSGAFIPVSEDEGMIAAVQNGSLT